MTVTLTQAKFDALVHHLEREALQQPQRFKHRVLRLAVIGYSYVTLSLVLLFWMIATIGTLKPSGTWYSAVLVASALVISLILAGLLLRSLWIWTPKPEGKKLQRRQAPQLFKLIDELTTELKTPRFHTILVDENLNAAVYQRPRLGIFGWFENYLILGLPLMQALTSDQFRAVLAHELGHLSGHHSRFAGWIYHIRGAWTQVLERLHQQYQRSSSGIWAIDTLMLIANGLGFVCFYGFLRWFIPQFDAHAFVLSRMNEYEADQCAARWVGTQHLAQALLAIELKVRYLKRSFWREVYHTTQQTSEPPDAMFQMFQALRSDLPEKDKERWLTAALRVKTSTDTTHPCLRERLKAIGCLAEISWLTDSLAVQPSAADDFLPQELWQQFATEMNQHWKATKQLIWKKKFESFSENVTLLAVLEEKEKIYPLSFEEKWQLCQWTADIKGAEVAIPLLQGLLAVKSYFAPANLLLGCLLLGQCNPIGIEHIESAISCDAELAMQGYQEIWEYLLYEEGDTERAQYYYNELSYLLARRTYAAI